MMLNGVTEIICKKCRYYFTVDASDMDVSEVGSEERNMGAEIFYAGNLQIRCPKCRSDIELNYEASEYPVGVKNYSDTHADGADIVRGFQDLDIYFEEEIYSFEEETRLYLPENKKIITNLYSGMTSLIHEVNKYPEVLYDIDPRKFEEFIAHLLALHGFSVELTKKTKDGGRDIIAIQTILDMKSKFLIECKRYAANKPISVGLVRSLHGVQQKEGANKSVLVTTSRFTKGAVEFATAKNTTEWAMDLKDFEDIKKWVNSAATNKAPLRG